MKAGAASAVRAPSPIAPTIASTVAGSSSWFFGEKGSIEGASTQARSGSRTSQTYSRREKT